MNHATYTDADGTTYYVEYGAPYKRTGSTMTARDLLAFALAANGITRDSVQRAMLGRDNIDGSRTVWRHLTGEGQP